MFLLADFGSGEVALTSTGALAIIGGFAVKKYFTEQEKHGDRLTVLETSNAESKGERLPQRVGKLETDTTEIKGDMREIKGDVRAIRSMLEGAQGGPHVHRRRDDPREENLK